MDQEAVLPSRQARSTELSSASLILGLGAIALVVRGVGIANVMFVSVLERRTEIGRRRALGATRTHIAAQFLAQALLLSATGGIVAALAGVGATASYAAARNWSVMIPPVSI